MSGTAEINLDLFASNQEQIETDQVFRPIHYLGSKLRMLDTIEDAVNQVDPSGSRVCDLFSGSGVVSRKLSLHRPVTSIDIQEYSRVLSSAILNPSLNASVIEQLWREMSDSKFGERLLWAVEPLRIYEASCIQSALTSSHNEALCDLLENGSIITYQLNRDQTSGASDLKAMIRETLSRLDSIACLTGPGALCTRLAGGAYFSYLQAAQTDILLHHIHNQRLESRDCLLAPLLSTLSNVVNTVGKQFAQPIRPRHSNGEIKHNLGMRIVKDRSVDIFGEYQKWIKRYSVLRPGPFSNQALRLDFAQALDELSGDTRVVYADPPYTRDHYSRYYHTLETICLRDEPEISTMVLKGRTLVSRGVYRKDRHQSPFCIKSQAPGAFAQLITKCISKGVGLVISYSPFDAGKGSHPRMMTMDDLISLAKKYYRNVETVSPGTFAHSKLNRTDKNLVASERAEVLITCVN